jgi:hypothetical protein
LIGADASQPQDLHGYLEGLRQGTAAARIPEVESVVYPGWFAWLEDIAQAVQVLASAAAVAALSAAVIWHADFFTTKRSETAGPDEWDEVLSRLHKRTVGNDN